MVPVPEVWPLAMLMLVSAPMSPDSAVTAVSVTGMLTLLLSAADSVAVIVTGEPSVTGSGAAESETVGVVGVAASPLTRMRSGESCDDQVLVVPGTSAETR